MNEQHATHLAAAIAAVMEEDTKEVVQLHPPTSSIKSDEQSNHHQPGLSSFWMTTAWSQRRGLVHTAIGVQFAVRLAIQFEVFVSK